MPTAQQREKKTTTKKEPMVETPDQHCAIKLFICLCCINHWDLKKSLTGSLFFYLMS
jgi:hypothetical protein